MNTTEDVIYCANGCSRAKKDAPSEKVLAVGPGLLCRSCLNRMEKWLEEIPDRYQLLPQYLLPSVALESNPESTHTKRPTAPLPLRLGALDLMDTRRGRKWSGLVPTNDRRGTIGTLLAIANEIRAQRGSKPRMDSTVHHEAATIAGGLELLSTSLGIRDIYTELKTLHRDLGDAIGQYPPKPVGACQRLVGETPEKCGGPLLPIHTGVVCPRCGETTGHDHLRLLGMRLKEGA